MRLEKSPFEEFVEVLQQRMEGRTLLVDFSDARMGEVERSVTGRIRQIGVLRSGSLSIPAYPGLGRRSIETFVLTNWAKVPAVVVTLYFVDEEHYRAEIIFDGKATSPYDESLLGYIKTFKDELQKVGSEQIHEASYSTQVLLS